MLDSMPKKFRALVANNAPVQVVGTINAYAAMLAEAAGSQAIYLSGAGVANASYGLPDLGMLGLAEVLEDARRITAASTLPLLVDVDTGWDSVFNIARTVNLMERAQVAAIHIEDQVLNKRCGHRPHKQIVSMAKMSDRIKAAVDARQDKDFVIMARTDAYAVDGLQAAIERGQLYMELGADMLFPESFTCLDEYKEFCRYCKVPILANITEFGKTPLFTKEELKDVGVSLILYPLSAFRAQAQAAFTVYKTIQATGSQRDVVATMQTRDELYQILDYYTYEQKLDQSMGGGDG